MKAKSKRSSILDNEWFLRVLVFTVLSIVYIFPQGLLSRYTNLDISVDKLLFTFVMFLTFVLCKISTKRITKSQIIFLALMLLSTALCQDLRCLTFIYLPVIEDLMPYRDRIINILKKTSFLYVCLGFTIFYTILYSSLGIVNADRFAFSAIAEINQSGLAIFCLAILLMLKNKKLGYVCMVFGLLTVSRSYYLAVVLYLISRISFVKRWVGKIKNWRLLGYPVLVFVSSVVLLLMGWFYIYQNSIGNVYWGDNVESRVFQLLDYSNLFRFVTNIALLMVFVRQPMGLLTGFKDSEYFTGLAESYSELGIPYKALNPHNLFFSHLRMYGLFALVETWYIGRIMGKIVNKNNLFVFLAIVLYSIILGAGLYSYWLFLSFLALSVEGRTAGINNMNSSGKTEVRI